jgi:hypothetical protein
MNRNVDTSNQYHLWVFSDPTRRFPFGWTTGKMLSDSTAGARQHPHNADR